MFVYVDDHLYEKLLDRSREIGEIHGNYSVVADLNLMKEKITSAKVIDPVTGIAILVVANARGVISLYERGLITADQIMAAKRRLERIVNAH